MYEIDGVTVSEEELQAKAEASGISLQRLLELNPNIKLAEPEEEVEEEVTEEVTPEGEEVTETETTEKFDPGFLSEYFSADPKTQSQKDFNYFDKDFNKVSEDAGSVWIPDRFGGGKGFEETVVPELNDKFKKWGFVFTQSDAFGDGVTVSSTTNPEVKKEFDLDDPVKGMASLRKYLEANKRDNAVYTDEVVKITPELFKSIGEGIETEDESILEGATRKIYASEGLDYDEIKNIENKSKENEKYINFIDKKLYGEYQKPMFYDKTFEAGMYKTKDEAAARYSPTPEEIKEYPQLFNEDGSLKVNVSDFKKELNDANESLADISGNPAIYDAKIKQANIFKDATNNATKEIVTTSEALRNESKNLQAEFQKITGTSINNLETFSKNIDNQIYVLDRELKNAIGITLEDIETYQPKTQEELNIINDIVNRYQTLNNEYIIPTQNILNGMNTLNAEGQRLDDIGNTINAILSYDDVYKIRGIYNDSGFQSTINNVKKGWSQGVVNREMLDVMYRFDDVTNDEDMANVARKVAEETAYQRGLLNSQVWERYQNATTVAEQMKILGTNPGEVLLSLFGNSMSMFTSTGAKTFFPMVIGSAGVGAGIGFVGGGGVGALPGAISGLGKGLLGWQTITGFNMEMGSVYAEELTKGGYDLTDANSIIEGLRDNEVRSVAWDRGIKRGIPIAVMNFIGGAVANGMVSPIATTGRQIANQFAKGLVVEPIFEATGETLAQAWGEGELTYTEIWNEAIGGVAGSQSNIAVAYAKNQFLGAQKKTADQLLNIDYIADNNYGLDKIKAFAERLSKKGIIDTKQYDAILENATAVDEANAAMRKGPKFISGSRRKAIRARLTDLAVTRHEADAVGATDLLSVIEAEMNEIATTGRLLPKSDIVTATDYIDLARKTIEAGTSFIKGRTGEDIGVINITDPNKLDRKMFPSDEVYNTVKKQLRQNKQEGGLMPGFVTDIMADGKQYIVMNNQDVSTAYYHALADGDLAGATVMGHEILHTVLDRSFEEGEVIDIGKELEAYINEDDGSRISKGAKKRITSKLKGYEQKYGGKDSRYYQEVFTTLSDEIAGENIEYGRQDKKFWQGIADSINDFMYKGKFDSDIANNIKIKSSEQAFQFIKDYNKTFYKKKRFHQTKTQSKAGKDQIGERESFIPEDEKSKATRRALREENIKEIYDLNAWGKTKGEWKELLEEDRSILNNLIDPFEIEIKAIAKGDQQLVAATKVPLIKHIKAFDPEVNKDLAGYIGSYLDHKVGTARKDLAKGAVPAGVKTKRIGEKREGEREFDIAAEEETDIKARKKREEAEVVILSDKIKVKPDTKKAITDRVFSINYMTLPDPTLEVSQNKTVTPFVSQLKQEIGKGKIERKGKVSRPLSPASRAMIKEMGGKGKFGDYLRENLKEIAKKLPLEYVAKNMPHLVMKSVDGEYTLDWQGKTATKEDKWSYEESGMTSQPRKQILKPKITNEDVEVVIESFTKPTGAPIQAKQEGLAYQVASELGLEQFAKSLIEGDKIAEKFKESQELAKRILQDKHIAKIHADLERGLKGIKASILQDLTPAQTLMIRSMLPLIASEIGKPGTTVNNFKTIVRDLLNDTSKLNPELELSTDVKRKISEFMTKVYEQNRKAEMRSGEKINLEKFLEKRTIYDFEKDILKALGLSDKTYKELLQDVSNVNALRELALKQAKWEIEVLKRDPLDVILDFLRYDKEHYSSAGKIGDKGFVKEKTLGEHGQQILSRDESKIDGRFSGQVFENVQDYYDNVINLIDPRYEVDQNRNVYRVEKNIQGEATYTRILTTKEVRESTEGKYVAPQSSKAVFKEINKYIKEGLTEEEAKKQVYKDRLAIAEKARERLKTTFEYLKHVNDPTLTAMMVFSLKSDMRSILRAAANIEHIFEGELMPGKPIKRNIKGKEVWIEDYYVYEHMIPAEVIMLSMVEAYFGKGKLDVDQLLDNYHVAIIPASMDDKLKEFGYQQAMPSGFINDFSKFIDRYYNEATKGSVQFAIKSLKDDKIHGQEWVDIYEMNNNIKTTLENRASLIPSGVIKTDQNNNGFVEASENMTNALNNSINPKAPVKKIRVFDFDDTLAKTNSKVFATREGEKKTLTAEQFAQDGARLEAEGWTMDFSDFDKVKEGKKGPMWDIAKKIEKARGNEDLYILTARNMTAAPAIKQFLDSMGLDFKIQNIVGLGNSTPQAKSQWIVEKAAEGYNDFYFTDDAVKNVEAVKKVLSPLDVKAKIQQASKGVRFSMTTKKDLKWKENSVGDLSTTFELNDKKYKVDFYPRDMEDTDYNLEFELETERGTTQEMTGTGDSMKVVSIVYNGLLDLVNKMPNVERIAFVSKASQESRVKVYNTLMEKLADKLGWNTDVWTIESFGKLESYEFELTKSVNKIEKSKSKFSILKPVKDVLNVVDIKSPIQQDNVRYSILSDEFNGILEDTKGIGKQKRYSAAKAKTIGASKGNFKFWIPYSAEDYVGLIYPTLSKGQLGDKQMAWYKENILDPYAVAMESVSKARINLMDDFKALKNKLKISDLLKDKNKSGFTNEQSVRIYIWNKQGLEVPGLSKADLKEALAVVNGNKKLKLFADQVININKGDKMAAPTKNWLVGNVTSDLMDTIDKVKRPKYLEKWQRNVDTIYSEENLNKLEAIYGSKYREALENMLARMKSGKNRLTTGNRLSNRILDYINGSVGAIMFLNMRSAVLQTISAINFVNWSFNNPLKAGAAFANQKQYWSDFSKLMNSDFLVDRRKGLRLNISEAEIADAAATSENKAKAVINWLLQKGYAPTQIADSFAIASGGATFYRNRINDLIKNEGKTKAEAEAQAYQEFREIAEESQQSSRPDKISAQQASDLGRILLAFANTPMQYARLQKRAAQDLVNGRGDPKSNISKIIYYGFVQNLIFNALQQAAFMLGFGDDEEEDEKAKEKIYNKTLNGMADSILRGLGIGGQTVSVVKNFLLDIYERSGRSRPEYSEAAWKLLKFSPPVSSKISKMREAAWPFESKKKRAEIYDKGFSIDNPAYESLAKVISATTNVPLDRVYSKLNNIEAALAEDSDWWQSVAMIAGWPEWVIKPKEKEKKKTKKGKGKIILKSPKIKIGGNIKLGNKQKIKL